MYVCHTRLIYKVSRIDILNKKMFTVYISVKRTFFPYRFARSWRIKTLRSTVLGQHYMTRLEGGVRRLESVLDEDVLVEMREDKNTAIWCR